MLLMIAYTNHNHNRATNHNHDNNRPGIHNHDAYRRGSCDFESTTIARWGTHYSHRHSADRNCHLCRRALRRVSLCRGRRLTAAPDLGKPIARQARMIMLQHTPTQPIW